MTNKAEVFRLLGELEGDSALESLVTTGADGVAAEEVVVKPKERESSSNSLRKLIQEAGRSRGGLT